MPNSKELRPKRKPWKLCLREVNIRILQAKDLGALCRFMASIYSAWNDVASQCVKKRLQKRAVILRKRFTRLLLICHQMREHICSQPNIDNAADDDDLLYEGLMAALLSQYLNVALLAIDTATVEKSTDAVMRLLQFLGGWPEKIVDSLLGITVLDNEDNRWVFTMILRRVMAEIKVKVTRTHYVKLVILIKRWLPVTDVSYHKEIWESLWDIPVSTRMEDFLRRKLKDQFRQGRSHDVVRSVLKRLSVRCQQMLLNKMDRKFKRALQKAILQQNSTDVEEVQSGLMDSEESLNEVSMIRYFFDCQGAQPQHDDSARQQRQLQLQLHENIDELIRDAEFTPVQVVARVRPMKNDRLNTETDNDDGQFEDISKEQFQVNEEESDANFIDNDNPFDNNLADLNQILGSSLNTETTSDDVVSVTNDEKSVTELTPMKIENLGTNEDNDHPSSMTDTDEFEPGIEPVPTVSPSNYRDNTALNSLADKRNQPVIVIERNATLDELSSSSNGTSCLTTDDCVLDTPRYKRTSDVTSGRIKRRPPVKADDKVTVSEEPAVRCLRSASSKSRPSTVKKQYNLRSTASSAK